MMINIVLYEGLLDKGREEWNKEMEEEGKFITNN